MRIPISWLREYVELPPDTSAITDRLAMLGFPVEEIVHRPTITGVIVGKIVSLERHPNADRLQICRIDAGDRPQLTIITAATNVAQGQTIPVATIGAHLPQLKIERRKLRGIESEGMLCSPDELALPPEWFEADGIMQLENGLLLGSDVVALLGLDGDVLDVEVTGNRVDAMSAIGLARELAASYGVPLQLPSFENPGAGEPTPPPSLEIESADCTRFVLQRFDGLRVDAAPAWMRVRLALCGVRPINNLVDVSNYVMLETAQPLHFYDATRVAGQRLVARDARRGEVLTTLDGVERKLTPSSLVIADSEHALGLAGVMGGVASEVTQQTTSILLESATFNGARVRRTAAQFGLRTEASSRHEKTLAPALAQIAAARAAHLIVQLGGTAYAPLIAGEPMPVAVVSLRASDVERLLGLHLPSERIASHLEALGCTVTRKNDDLEVTAPAWRNDVAIAADLVEEVARIEGYDTIEAAVPSVAPHQISSREYALESAIAQTMRALGYHEIITHSLHGVQRFEHLDRNEAAFPVNVVELRNPLSEDQRFLRMDVAPALIEYLARLGRAYRLFEMGHVFAREGDAVVESPVLTFAYAAEHSDDPDWRDTEFFRLKGDVDALLRAATGRVPRVESATRAGLHPGKTATAQIDGVDVGAFGRVDPRLERAYGAEFPLYLSTVRLDRLPERVINRYRPPSRFPSTYRDLSLVLDPDVSAERVESVTAEAIGDLCKSTRVFDEYRGPQVGNDRKSLAVRATMQRYDGTITDEEADAAIVRAVEALRRQLGASVRS